jgi:succinoglycan biosynthesis transport protein ExoP
MRDSLVHPSGSQQAAQFAPISEHEWSATSESPLDRPIAAVRRYKWLIVVIAGLSSVAGFLATRLVTPEYEVRATVWVESTRPNQERSGPIRSAELLNSTAWIELFRSYRVVDDVVRKLALYVSPENPADKSLFESDKFALAERFRPGRYELRIDRSRQTWKLATAEGLEIERGSAADSVGRKVGFRWSLATGAFTGDGERAIRFTVVTPRETSIQILNRVNNRLAPESNFLWLTYQDPDGALAARTLNTWLEEYVRVAAELKKRNVVEFANILEEQLRYAEKATQDAEAAYQNFRVNTIILPTEGGPVAARNIEGDRDPALTSFFDQKIEYDNLRHDREALEQVIASASAGQTPYEGVLFIPSIAQGPGAEALRAAFTSQYNLQADLRVKRQNFTDEHPAIIETKNALTVLQQHTIPGLANQLLEQLKERENDYLRRIQAASNELRQIPPRTIEERRLNRAVLVSEQLYTNLKSRYAEARLAEASATPDVSVLDTAIAPLAPNQNTGAALILLGIVGGIGVAIGIALLLDRIDGKFRYAVQTGTDLGLTIAATVPRIPKGGIDARSPEQVVQFVESFRTLRMHVVHSCEGRRLTVAVTSAAPADGKSLIATNLALSFAEGGLKTVLVDGDTRRGTLHRLHGMKLSAGLTEYLAGSVDVPDVVRPTPHDNLSIVSSGRRDPRSPELLTSPRLKELIDRLSRSFDVVIIDTPPLAAGIDGYAIAAATGNVLMVVRMGQTERRLAAAKLETLDRLPVQILGACLNAVPMTSEFQYYQYSRGYSIDVESSRELTSGVGAA